MTIRHQDAKVTLRGEKQQQDTIQISRNLKNTKGNPMLLAIQLSKLRLVFTLLPISR